METTLELQILGNVLAAALLGGLVGIEREFAGRPAKLRTHMLVGATAASIKVNNYRLEVDSFESRMKFD